jgi:uncharacterized protein involved in exopolysaccharide biosynthesis
MQKKNTDSNVNEAELATLDSAHGDSDYIDLSHLFMVAWRNRVLLGAFVVAGIAGALLLQMSLTPKWRASATLQIGQVPVSSTAGPVMIEQQAVVVEKFKLRDAEILMLAGYQREKTSGKSASLLRSSLKAIAVKNTNLVQVNVAGYSATEARRNITAATKLVIDEHAALLAPTVTRLNEQLRDNVREIQAIRASKKKVQALLDDTENLKSAALFGPAIAAMQLMENKDLELRRLEAEGVILKEMLGPAKLSPTKLVNPVRAENRPYFPNRKLFVAIGLVLGALAGVAAVFGREQFRKRAA